MARACPFAARNSMCRLSGTGRRNQRLKMPLHQLLRIVGKSSSRATRTQHATQGVVQLAQIIPLRACRQAWEVSGIGNGCRRVDVAEVSRALVDARQVLGHHLCRAKSHHPVMPDGQLNLIRIADA